MALLPAFVFFCWLAAVVSTVPGGNGNDISNGENRLHAKHDFMRNLGEIIGYRQISANKHSDGLFSEEETRKIISHESYEEKLDAADYRDPCAHDLVRVAFSLKEKWAISMIDADGKLPAGVLTGNIKWAGAYGECISVQAPRDLTDNQAGFDGRYCTLSWTINALKMSISTGVCVPDTCQEADFYNITNVQLVQKSRKIVPQLNGLSNSSSNILSLTGISCQSKTMDYDAGATAVLVILFTFLFLVITGTSLTVIEAPFPRPPSPPPSEEQQDLLNTSSTDIKFEDALKRNSSENAELAINCSGVERLIPKSKGPSIPERIGDILKCFCLIKNGTKILDTSNKEGVEFRCLHGIRFLSMAWVILGHTYAFPAILQVIGNLTDLMALLDGFSFQMILQGTYSVDSFFVLSGFLLTYVFLREMNARDGKISWLAFYLHRYWRLTPVYAVVMAFNTTIPLYLISGPLQPSTYETGCRTGWWWNLLYVNNFAPNEDTCMGWSWYLANDMQFYVISPIFLYSLWKWPKIGLGIVIGLFCGCWISNFAISYHYDLFSGFTTLPGDTNILNDTPQLAVYFDKIYNKPYTRIGPYLIGVFVAYVFFQVKDRENFLSKRTQAIGWLASTGMGLYMIFGMYHAKANLVESCLYNAFNRSCFSASLAWVIFACLTGYGGVVNKILSHSVFIPLGRLTYCAYLIHPIVMTVYYLCLPNPLLISHSQMVLLFFGFLLASYGIAFATTLMFESPTMAIERLLRSGSAAKKGKPNRA